MKKMLPALAAIVLVLAPAHGANRMRVTFPGYSGNRETLTNFPVLVTFADNIGGSGLTFKGNPFLDPNGLDLRFYDEGGFELPYEVDTHEPGELLLAWVKLRELKSDGSTVVTATWGDPEDADPKAYATNGAVWTNDFLIVHHFNEPTGAANIKNATPAVRTDTMRRNNSQALVVHTQGVIGKGGDFAGNGNNNGILITPNVPAQSLNADWTMGVWVRDMRISKTDWRTLFRGTSWCQLLINNGTDDLCAWFSSAQKEALDAQGKVVKLLLPERDVWHYLAAVGDNTSKTIAMYLDGVWIGTVPDKFSDSLTSVNCYNNGNQQFADYLDEVRVAIRARSADWLWAEYENQKPGSTFAAYAPEMVDSLLVIECDPPGMGKAEPTFGWHFDVGAGSNILASASVWTNDAQNTLASPTGWEVFAFDGVDDYVSVTNNSTWSFLYEHPQDTAGRIVWAFAISNLFTVTPSAGGNVDGAGWHHRTNAVTLAANAQTGFEFYRWSGDLPPSVSNEENPLELPPGSGPLTVRADFIPSGITGKTRYVAPDGDDKNSGFFITVPMRNIATAVADLGTGGGLVIVSNGVYNVGQQIEIKTPVVVQGFTGNPADVVVKRNPSVAYTRIFMVDHPDAVLQFLTVADGTGLNEGSPGGNILLENGTVEDCLIFNGRKEGSGGLNYGGNLGVRGNGRVLRCVIAGGFASGAGCTGGAVLINGGGALVEQCLITNNTCGASNDGAVIFINSGGGTVANCTIARNYSVNGGAIRIQSSSIGKVVNSVIVDNTSGINPAQSGGGVLDGGRRDRYFNCVADVFVNTTCANAVSGFGFVDPANGDYRLTVNALACEFGDIAQHEPVSLTDLDGNPRVSGLHVDAGCYEYPLDMLLATFDAQGAREQTAPFTVNFTARTANAQDEVEHVWDFGDGSPWVTNALGVATASHLYTTPGWFTVTLWVDDGFASTNAVRRDYIRANSAATGRTLTWANNNAANNLWDTTSANWNNGAAVFRQGDNVAFNPTGSLSVDLCQDTGVNAMEIRVPLGETWTLNGTESIRLPGDVNNPLRFLGPGEMRFNTPFDANHIEMQGGTVWLMGGHEFTVRNRTYFNWGNTTLIITNATLHSLPTENFSMGVGYTPAGDRNVVRVLKDGVLNVKIIRMGQNSANNLLQIDGGTFNQIGNTAMFGAVGGQSNRLEVVNGGTYTSTGCISLGYREHHSLLFDNATVTLDDGNNFASNDYLHLGGGEAGYSGHYHVGAITNSTVDVGRLSVGQAYSWARLFVHGSSITCHDSGSGANSYDGFYVGTSTSYNRADIVNSTVNIPRNGLCVGVGGHYNVLNIVNSTVVCNGWGFNISRGGGGNNVAIIGPGSTVIANNQITLCQITNPGGNEIRLAGGSISTNSKFEWCNSGVLGVEIQPDGLPGHLSVAGPIDLAGGGQRVRPRAAKGAKPGTYLVMESIGAANIPNFIFDPPEDQKDRWSYEGVGTKKLFITYKAPYTLFMIR